MLANPNPESIRRTELHRLDMLLAHLEGLNLRDHTAVPLGLGERLRQAGVGYPAAATVSEVIDLVFRAQERYLTPLDTHTGKRPSRMS